MCIDYDGMKVVRDGIGFEARTCVVVVNLEMIVVDGGKDSFVFTRISVVLVSELVGMFVTGTETEVVMVDDGTQNDVGDDVCVMVVGMDDTTLIILETDNETGT